MGKFKPQHRLDYIKEINALNIESECHLRSVIHQSYYAALNQLKYEIDNRLFFPMDEKDRHERSHQAVIDACENQIRKLPSTDKARRQLLTKVSNNMKRARKLRVDADYRFDIEIVSAHANVATDYANQIFNNLEDYQ
jgi:hypothetical protein